MKYLQHMIRFWVSHLGKIEKEMIKVGSTALVVDFVICSTYLRR